MQDQKLGPQVTIFTINRILLNTVVRMVYPFLTVFARGLGVELRTIEILVAARSGLGIISPVLSTTADSFGRRWAMLVAMAAFVGGAFTIFLFPTLLGFAIGLFLTLLGKILFDPSVQAYVSDRVPYARRGRALATLELGWSLSFILGVPAAALIIQRASWQTPFAVFGAIAVISTLLLVYLTPNDAQPTDTNKAQVASSALRRIASDPAALAGISIGFLISVANEMVNITFAAWLEGAFGLAVTGLGVTAGIIGVADLIGEGIVIGFVDRIGKRRMLIAALLANGLAAVGLPFLAQFGQMGALVGLFIFFFSFEITIVSSIPLVSELAADARATLMGGYSAAASAGRMVGAVISPVIFRHVTLGLPMLANGMVAMLVNLVAIVVLVRFVQQD